MDTENPFARDLEEFLTGRSTPDIDPIFGKRFDQALAAFMKYAPEDIVPEINSLKVPSLFAEGFYYKDIPAGVALFDQADNLAGFYAGCDLSLDAQHQGRGLGSELVIERCIRDGENPVLNLDVAAYSPAGYAAHAAAWTYANKYPHNIKVRMTRWTGEKQ